MGTRCAFLESLIPNLNVDPGHFWVEIERPWIGLVEGLDLYLQSFVWNEKFSTEIDEVDRAAQRNIIILHVFSTPHSFKVLNDHSLIKRAASLESDRIIHDEATDWAHDVLWLNQLFLVFWTNIGLEAAFYLPVQLLDIGPIFLGDLAYYHELRKCALLFLEIVN